MTIRRWRSAIFASLMLSACADNPVAVGSSDISILAAKQPPAPPGPTISVIALGSLPTSTDRGAPIASALNTGTTRAATRVAGSTRYGSVPEHPFTWTKDAGISPLPVIEPHYGWPSGISAGGVIVGEINTSSGLRAFVVTAAGPMTYLPVPSGTTHSGATGITSDGSCISGSVSSGGVSQAAVWRNGVIEILGIGSARGVSDDCSRVVSSFNSRAAVWTNVAGTWTVDTLPARGAGSKFIGPVRYAEGIDISPSGEYVSGRRVDSASTAGVVWRRTAEGWIATDLPGSNGFPFGVDNKGRAVGHNSLGEPALWTRSSTGVYASRVLPPLERSTQGWPAAINELGQIAGRSRTREGWQPVLWTILE